jgi:molecular chaperone DnaK (HSP70)
MPSRYVIGIDLGTTNTVVAFADTERAGAHVEVMPVEQLVGPGEVAALPLLPSFLYLPGPHELPEGATRLPWGEPNHVVGQFARAQGSRVPGRLVVSAKSWLCHAAVDREAPILPWGAPPEVSRVSPVEASARYLEHVRLAWNRRFPNELLESQEVVLTVPASFDEVARELTVRAAQQAGLNRFVLLEEPQAAFYDFLSRHGQGRAQALAQALAGVKLVLVVDVGGGTTDLTLIHAQTESGDAGQPRLTRLAVGDHLMLGGDNMDMLLARTAEERLAGNNKLDATQWSMLVQSARQAKETLLGPQPPASVKVTVAGRGSRLVGGSMSTELTGDEVQRLLVEGFFPHVAPDAQPLKATRSAIQELGLPFASDPAISRHVVGFLRRHASGVAEALGTSPNELPRPDAVLLNGGVFNSPTLQKRLLEVVNAWFPAGPAVKLLPHESLDLAVARGASWFGRVRRGEGLRIGGGSARAYYVGVETQAETKLGLCVVSRRQEEGAEAEVPNKTFALLLNRPARFPLFSSSGDAQHARGDLVPLDDASPLPPIETVLAAPNGLAGQVPVRLASRLTELGTLELFCVATSGSAANAATKDLRWKLEFQLRGRALAEGRTQVEPLPARFEQGREAVERVYGKKPLPFAPRDVKDLFRNLEKLLGPREGWSTAVCRELWSELYAGMSRRRRTADHERVWCQLTGFSLRPGFGHPLDAWRAAETWKAFEPGLQFHTEKTNWNEWWILWRRIAGGLDEAAHRTLWNAVFPHLKPVLPNAKPTKTRGVKPEGHDEMVRLAASLERVDAKSKTELGDILLERLVVSGASHQLAWAIGRLGTRRPLYGSAHTVVPIDVATRWLEVLLGLDWTRVEGAPFAAMMLSRVTFDRSRDLESIWRERVAERLASMKSPELWIKGVREGVEMQAAEEARAFGDSLPAGLKLLDESE